MDLYYKLRSLDLLKIYDSKVDINSYSYYIRLQLGDYISDYINFANPINGVEKWLLSLDHPAINLYKQGDLELLGV